MGLCRFTLSEDIMQHISVIQMLILAGSMHIINTCWGPEGTSGNIIDSLREAYWGHYSLHTHTFTIVELRMVHLQLNGFSYLDKCQSHDTLLSSI